MADAAFIAFAIYMIFIILRKEVVMMTTKLTIGFILLMVMVLSMPENVRAEKMLLSAVDKDIAIKKGSVKFKCDPCDYNIDYGNQDSPAAKGKVDEGFIEIKCDPCDYNIDYG